MRTMEHVLEWWNTKPSEDIKTKFGHRVCHLVMYYRHDDGRYGACDNLDITWWSEDNEWYDISYDFEANIELFSTHASVTIRTEIHGEDMKYKDENYQIFFDSFVDFSEEELFQYSTVAELPPQLEVDDIRILATIASELQDP